MEIIANGKRYDVKDNGYIYLDNKRVSKAQMMADLEEDVRPSQTINQRDTQNEVLERAEQRPLNTTKANTMTYEDKLALYGIDRAALERKVGKAAYKPGNYDTTTGKQYMGSYLINLKGKAKVVGETTFKGNLTITDVNMKSVGFYMPELFNISETKMLSEFESVRPGTLSLDDLGDIDEPEQLVDMISVWRVKFADLDLVTFLNETTGDFMGTKSYQVYKAEQEARLKRPSTDQLFDELLEAEVKEQEAGYHEEAELSA